MNLDFEDEWYGWRLRGRHLVSDDGQRMTIERLRGLIWRDRMELRLAGYATVGPLKPPAAPPINPRSRSW